MAEDEVQILAKILRNQNNIVQKLQQELDEERNAAASGAEEALCMILRLQEEKSTQQMESLQYKRMVEEKLRQNEEAVAVMREIVFLKDTEIDALRYQLEVCKNKLLNLCVEGDHFPWSNGYMFGKGPHQNLGRKNFSLPSTRFEELRLEIEDSERRDAGSIFDDFGNNLTKRYKERKFENLFRSKSSIKEISSSSDGFKSDSYNPEDEFPSLKLNRGEIPLLPLQKKWPRRSSSVLLLHNSCTNTEFISNPQDTSDIPERLKRTPKYNLDFENDERLEKSMSESDLEHVKLSLGCIKNEIKKIRESDSVASKKQLELLVEIRDKINALESHIQQRDSQIDEETSTRQRQVKAASNQPEDLLMSYYIEAMLFLSM